MATVLQRVCSNLDIAFIFLTAPPEWSGAEVDLLLQGDSVENKDDPRLDHPKHFKILTAIPHELPVQSNVQGYLISQIPT
jgi:hypothetical protein